MVDRRIISQMCGSKDNFRPSVQKIFRPSFFSNVLQSCTAQHSLIIHHLLKLSISNFFSGKIKSACVQDLNVNRYVTCAFEKRGSIIPCDEQMEEDWKSMPIEEMPKHIICCVIHSSCKISSLPVTCNNYPHSLFH